MRQILFKAKRVDNGEWVKGFYRSWKHFNGKGYEDVHSIYEQDLGECIVIPETVCEYTGLNDKNGKMLWEKDILHHKEHKGYLLPDFKAHVLWVDEYACFGYKRLDLPDWNYPTYFTEHDELKSDFLDFSEIIGNIHD
jgi:hypothetical protein